MNQNVDRISAAFPALVTANAETSGPNLSDQRDARRQADQLVTHRLIIEGDPQTGFIYKSVDRQTGRIVSEFPRETVIRLQADPGYAQGSVIDTQA